MLFKKLRKMIPVHSDTFGNDPGVQLFEQSCIDDVQALSDRIRIAGGFTFPDNPGQFLAFSKQI